MDCLIDSGNGELPFFLEPQPLVVVQKNASEGNETPI